MNYVNNQNNEIIHSLQILSNALKDRLITIKSGVVKINKFDRAVYPLLTRNGRGLTDCDWLGGG